MIDPVGGTSSENDIWYTAGIEGLDEEWIGFADLDSFFVFDRLCGGGSDFAVARLPVGYQAGIYFVSP